MKPFFYDYQNGNSNSTFSVIMPIHPDRRFYSRFFGCPGRDLYSFTRQCRSYIQIYFKRNLRQCGFYRWGRYGPFRHYPALPDRIFLHHFIFRFFQFCNYPSKEYPPELSLIWPFHLCEHEPHCFFNLQSSYTAPDCSQRDQECSDPDDLRCIPGCLYAADLHHKTVALTGRARLPKTNYNFSAGFTEILRVSSLDN